MAIRYVSIQWIHTQSRNPISFREDAPSRSHWPSSALFLAFLGDVQRRDDAGRDGFKVLEKNGLDKTGLEMEISDFAFVQDFFFLEF